MNVPSRPVALLVGVLVYAIAGLGATSALEIRRDDVLARLRGADEPAGLGTVIDPVLSPGELAEERVVRFALRMRNAGELQERVNRGEVMSPAELSARYFPRREVWQRVAHWARARGLKVDEDDPTYLGVNAVGTVAHLQRALKMRFARVLGSDLVDHTSAATAPVLDSSVDGLVLSVLHLQPHVREQPQAAAQRSPGGGVLPRHVAENYNALGSGFDGSGQTIVVTGSGEILAEDLRVFSEVAGIPDIRARLVSVSPPRVTVLPTAADSKHQTMCIQWAAAMAPGARIVHFKSLEVDEILAWVMSESQAGRTVRQMSYSSAIMESVYTLPASVREARSQEFLALAGLGVSVFVSSGNWGSTQKVVNGIAELAYDPTGIVSPCYPASDPNVTGVGGTTIIYPHVLGNPQLPAEEVGWTLPANWSPASLEKQASGGGVSLYFSRPSWQRGPGVPDGAMRCVPDVAALAASNFGHYTYWNGLDLGGASGTSVAAPIWAGLCALINQARQERGLPPAGLLGPRIYPLVGTASFRTVVRGSNGASDPIVAGGGNGAYAVGPNYNLVTGLGPPDLSRLIEALSAPETPSAPSTPPATGGGAGGGTSAGGSVGGGGGGGGGAPSIGFLLAIALVFLARRQTRGAA